MSEQWLQDYMLLALRMDEPFFRVTDTHFVDYYYGPPDLKSVVENEAEMPAPELVKAATVLLASLPAQNFEPQRATYLEKQVTAMETICRKMNGESFSLEKDIQRCFDSQLVWTPETQFEQAHALYDAVLPGKGNIQERLGKWRDQFEIPLEKVPVLAKFIAQALAESRARTSTFVHLPENERIDLQIITKKEYDAANRYQGNYCSHVEVDISSSRHLARLMDHIVCHEGYPGHHTEFVLKEQELYHKRGYTEQAIALTISPQSVISEGIAMLACDMIFPAGEAEQWMVTTILPEMGLVMDAHTLLQLHQASDLSGNVWCNALMLREDGQSDIELARYFMKYMLLTRDVALEYVASLKKPLIGNYIATYFCGQQLMQPLLQGMDRLAVFRRLLMEQIYPSMLTEK